MDTYTLLTNESLKIRSYYAILSVLFILLVPSVYFQTHHRFHDKSTEVKEFEDWLDTQFNESNHINLIDVFEEYDEELQDLSLQAENRSGKFEEIIQKAKEHEELNRRTTNWRLSFLTLKWCSWMRKPPKLKPEAAVEELVKVRPDKIIRGFEPDFCVSRENQSITSRCSEKLLSPALNCYQ